MSKKTLLTVIIIFFMSVACSSLKRHKSASYKGDDSSLADIDLFGYSLYDPGEINAPGNLWNLNATAQANLLKIFDRRFTDNESFIRALNNRYITGNSIMPETTYTNKNLRLVLTISKKRDYRSIGNKGHPGADRIEYLKISIILPDSLDIEFTNWNRFNTEYADIEVADVSFNKSIDLSADAGISAGNNVERTANTGIKGSLSHKEDQFVRYRYLKMNGKLDRKRVEIEEEGTREIDLTGNIIADISLAFSSFNERVFIPVYDRGKEESTAGKMTLMPIDAIVPAIASAAAPVRAILEMEFVYRHVSSGSNTFQEWDDAVDYYTGKVQKEITLLDIPDYLPPLHTIGIQGKERDILRVKTEGNKYYALKFRTYEEAVVFHEWLMLGADSKERDDTVKAGEYSLYLGTKELKPGMIQDNLTVIPYYAWQ